MVIRMTADGTVPKNSNLRDAPKAKNDEFYTQWARLVSNQRPLACEASALPLSYAP